IVDDEICSIGTANFDLRSFEQNFEVNAVVYDREIAREMKGYFNEDCQNSTELLLDDYLQRPWIDKMKEGLAKIFSPIL
ncbi:MAG: hypothetical protein KDD15_25135, partial [Lewinella sp.]|nr:hypothetical protein [Lewinella sp.]